MMKMLKPPGGCRKCGKPTWTIKECVIGEILPDEEYGGKLVQKTTIRQWRQYALCPECKGEERPITWAVTTPEAELNEQYVLLFIVNVPSYVTEEEIMNTLTRAGYHFAFKQVKITPDTNWTEEVWELYWMGGVERVSWRSVCEEAINRGW
jgi:hypothetical protein